MKRRIKKYGYGGAIAGGAQTGISIGGKIGTAVGGPFGTLIGMGAGAVLGGAMGAGGQYLKEKQEDRIIAQQEALINGTIKQQEQYANQALFRNFPVRGIRNSEFGYGMYGMNLKQKPIISNYKPLKNGGKLVTGDKHGQDSDGDGKQGVPVYNQNGQQTAEIESGEVEYDGLVFSKRMFSSTGSSFADTAKSILESEIYTNYKNNKRKNEKRLADNPNDKYIVGTAKRNLERPNPLEVLFQEQEAMKAEMEQQQGGDVAMGAYGLNLDKDPVYPNNPENLVLINVPYEAPFSFGQTSEQALGMNTELSNVQPFSRNENFLKKPSKNFLGMTNYSKIKQNNNISNGPVSTEARPMYYKGDGLPWTYGNNDALGSYGTNKTSSNPKDFSNKLGNAVNKFDPNGLSGAIGEAAQFGYRFLDNIDREKLPTIAPPPKVQAPRLKTTFNVGANLRDAANTYTASSKGISRQLNKGNAAANINNLYAQNLKNKGQIFQQKENIETNLKNQQAQSDFQANMVNIQNDINYIDKTWNISAADIANKNENVANMVDDISAYIQDNYKERYDDEALEVMIQGLDARAPGIGDILRERLGLTKK
jgi:hypothetical protein